MKRFGILAAALIATAGLAMAQVRQTRWGTDPTGIEPSAGDAGVAVCFGDGTGAKCGGGVFGSAGHGCNNHYETGGAILSAHGVARLSNDSLELDVAGLPYSTTLLYMQGSKLAANGAGYTFGDGVMCLSGTIRQLGSERVTDGYGTYPGLGQRRVHVMGKVSMLEPTQVYQVMYRDWGGPSVEIDNFNLSNAWIVRWAP